MTRRFWAGIIAAVAGAQSKPERFYITGGWSDCSKPPLVVEARNRLDALARAGFTVWTEEEWTRAEKLGDSFGGVLPCGGKGWPRPPVTPPEARQP